MHIIGAMGRLRTWQIVSMLCVGNKNGLYRNYLYRVEKSEFLVLPSDTIKSCYYRQWFVLLSVHLLQQHPFSPINKWRRNIYQSSPMGTLNGKVQRLATVGLDTSSTIQSISFFSRIAMLLGKSLNGCQSWMMVALGRTPCIRSLFKYSCWIAVWSRRTGGGLEQKVDKVDSLSPSRPNSERCSLRSSALKRISRIPWREKRQH